MEDALRFPVRHPWLTVFLAVFVVVFSVIGIFRLQVSTNIRAMLAKGDPSAEAMAQIVENHALVDEALVLVSLPESKKPPTDQELESLKNYARRFVIAVQSDVDLGSMAKQVSWTTSPQFRQFGQEVLVPSGVFYLSEAEFETLRARLKPEQMSRMIAASEAMLAAPGPVGDGLSQLSTRDPLKLHEFLLAHANKTRGALPTYQNGSEFITPDGRMLMIRILGERPASDLDFSRGFTAAIRQTIDHVRQESPGLQVELAGAYAIAAESERAIRSDMITNLWSSTLAIALLFLCAYRSFWCWPIAMVPLAWGIVASFGAYSIFSTEITPLTGAIGAVLTGLAIDYCIHYLSQFMGHLPQDVRQLTREDLEKTTLATARAIGLAMSAACATSILAFAAIGLSRLAAIREFALLASLGLVFVFLGVFTLLPALLTLMLRSGTARTAMALRMNPARFIEGVSRRATPSIAFSAVIVCAAAAITLASPALFDFESDLTVMHPAPNPPLDAQHKMADRFGSDFGGFMIRLKLPLTPDAGQKLTALAHEVDRRMQRPRAQAAGIGGTIGLASLLPDPEIASRRTEQLASIDSAKVAADLSSAIEQSEYLEPAAYASYVKLVEQLVSAREVPSLETLRKYDDLTGAILPRGAFDRDIAQTHEAVTLVWTTRALTNQHDRTEAIDAIRESIADLPGATLTGLPVLGHDTESIVRQDLSKQLGLAAALVVVWMLFSFRSITDTLLALLPATGTLAMLLATMDLLGAKFNMVSLITLPMLVGIGVDYGIFAVCIAREHRMAVRLGEPERALGERLAVGFHALLMTTATTVIGLGTLAFTSVPAIQSLGWSAGGAMAACLTLTACLLMPLLVLRERAWERRRANRPS